MLKDNGKFISASEDGIKVFKYNCFISHSEHIDCNSIESLIVHADGNKVIFSSENRLYISEIGGFMSPRILYENKLPINCFSVSADRDFVVIGSKKLYRKYNKSPTLKLISLSTGEVFHEFGKYSGNINATSISRDNKILICSSDSQIYLFDLHSGRKIFSIRRGETEDGFGLSINVLMSISHNRIISGAWNDNIIIWSNTRNQNFNILEYQIYGQKGEGILSLAITDDERYLVSAHYKGMIRVWNLKTHEELRIIKTKSSSAVSVTPITNHIISAGKNNLVEIFDLHTGKLKLTFHSESSLTCCAITPDGKTITAGDSAGRVYFLRLENLDMST